MSPFCAQMAKTAFFSGFSSNLAILGPHLGLLHGLIATPVNNFAKMLDQPMNRFVECHQRHTRIDSLGQESQKMADVTRLPGPNSDFWDWQLDALCRGLDSAVFYHPDGERGMARERRVANAKAVCAACPVARQCLEHALAVREPYGVWGGLSEEEREVLYRRLDRSVSVG